MIFKALESSITFDTKEVLISLIVTVAVFAIGVLGRLAAKWIKRKMQKHHKANSLDK